MSIYTEESILQFGTGKFLRCFVDLFVHETNQGRAEPLGITAVQSTGAGRARSINRQGGRYHVAIRGLECGERVDRVVEVASVGRALAAESKWENVLATARAESLEAIVSNVTEAGYRTDPRDAPDDAPPPSFPAKLAAVLRSRFEAGLPPVTILPCELLEKNARRLMQLVLEVAERWRLSEQCRQWIRSECSWHDTLVDRIVSAPAAGEPWAERDPLFAVAEPFALWLVEGSVGVRGLSEHAAVEVVDDLAPHHLRKVRILNGAHTALVAKARPLGIETVRQAVEDQRVRPWLEALLFEEIVPVLEGRTHQPRRFAEAALERFANPFLEHRLDDIALHHDMKLQTRLAPTFREFSERFGRRPKLLSEILVGH